MLKALTDSVTPASREEVRKARQEQSAAATALRGAESALTGVKASVTAMAANRGRKGTLVLIAPDAGAIVTEAERASLPLKVETLNQPEQLGEVMRRAFSLLKNGRPGPVMVEIPATFLPCATTSSLASNMRVPARRMERSEWVPPPDSTRAVSP